MIDHQLRVTVVRRVSELESLLPEWEALLTRQAEPSVYQTPDWILTWIRHFETPNGIYVVVVRRDGELVGVAPFSRTGLTRRFAPQVLTSTSAEHDADGDPLVCDGASDVADAIAEHLARLVRHGFTVVSVRDVREDGPFHRALLRCRRVSVVRSSQMEAPIVDFRTVDDPLGMLDRRMRSHRIPRRRRRLEERFGSVAFDPDDGDVEGALGDMRTMIERRWGARNGPSLFDDPRRSAFTVEVFEQLHAHGFVTVAVLRAEQRRVAVQVVSRVGDRFVCEHIAHDTDLLQFGVGQMLLGEVLNWCVGQGASRVDLRGPRSDYKDVWANTAATMVTVHLVLPTVFGRAQLKVRKPMLKPRRARLGRSTGGRLVT